MTTPRAGALCGAAAALATTLTTACAQDGAQAVALFDGASLDGWTPVNAAPETFTIADGALRVGGGEGWLRADGTYSDFRLAAEFRFLTDDADSGIFVRVADDGGEFIRGWPNEAYQVQLRNPLGTSPFPPVGGLFRHGMPQGETVFDSADAARLSAGTGAWQTLEIEAVGERLSVRLNDALLSEATGIANASGRIGIQAEVGALEFRAITIETELSD